jgi:putative ABC transport system permease protein
MDTANGRVGEIVGVVGNAKPNKLDSEEWSIIYNPYPQAAAVTMEVAVRTAGRPTALAPAVARVVHELDPEQPLAAVRPMEEILDQALAAPRFNALMLGIFAAIAFVLAAVGIYGVISYDISQRTHEIGIRVALGAESKDVLRLVVGEGARLAGVGIALGVGAALALTRRMADMLYGIQPTDVYTFTAMSLLLGAVALWASYLPSRRAMALEPLAALRHE